MNFDLSILGTASALPAMNRYPSAQVLDVRGRLFLIDCGEGAQMQMRRMSIPYARIDNICISHIHGDHLFGLFGLLSTMSMLGRTAHLNIFAPAAFSKVLKFYLSMFGEGSGFEIEHHVLAMKSPEKVWESKSVEMLAFPLDHRIETYGFIIREKMPAFNVHKEYISRYGLTLAEIAALKRGEDVVRPAGDDTGPSLANGFRHFSGTSEPLVIPNSEAAYIPYRPRSYAYCSDTAPFPELHEWVRGVTLLYHESTFPDALSDMAVKTHHSTARQAAECARDAGVSRLVIGHYSSRFSDTRIFLEEASSVFPDTILAAEGLKISVPLEKWPFSK